MAKRLFDLSFAAAALIVTLPILIPACFLIWLQDGHWPLYAGLRVGRGGRDFRMIKLRTMVANADRLGGSSTAISDSRLTPLGAMLRRCKIDELPQFWNVLTGDMSVVGPRPNVRNGGVDRYTLEELQLLSLRPGITDLASIVFADEGEILNGSADPDALYDSVIRPWKNRLGLIYVERRTMLMDLELVALTLLALFSRRAALRDVGDLLRRCDAPPELRRICARSEPLPAGEPPNNRSSELACR
jgi:lipopolysaccharide/colanic/teichoic acid biosynthesis glycosyltransferase